MRDTHARHNTSGADRAGPHPHFDRVGTGIDDGLRAILGGDVAPDHIHPAESFIFLELLDDLQYSLRVTIGGVDHEDIHPRLEQCTSSIPGVTKESDSSTDSESAFGIFRGVGILFALVKVLDRNQTFKVASAIDQGQLLNLLSGKNCERFLWRDSLVPGNQLALGHHVFHQGGVGFIARHETHIAVGDDAHQHTITLDHGDPRDSEGCAQLIDIRNSGIGGGGDGVGNHA